MAMTTRVPLSRANILFYTGVASRDAEKLLDGLLRDGVLEIDSDDDGELLYTVSGAKRPSNGSTELLRCSACQRVTGAASCCARCGQYLDSRLRALKEEVDRERGTGGGRRGGSAPSGPPVIDFGDGDDGRAGGDGGASRGSRSLLDGRLRLRNPSGDVLQMVRDLERFRRDGYKPAVADEKNVAVGGFLGLFGPLGWFYAAPHREAGLAAAVFFVAASILPRIVFIPLLTLLLPVSVLIGVLYAWQYNRSGQRTGLFLDGPEDGAGGGSAGRPRRSR